MARTNGRPRARVGEVVWDRLPGVNRALPNLRIDREDRRHDDRSNGEDQSEGADALESEIGPGNDAAGRQCNGDGGDRGQATDRLQSDHCGEQADGSRNRRANPGWPDETKNRCGRREHKSRSGDDHRDQSQEIAHVQIPDREEFRCPSQDIVDRLSEREAA